MLHLRWRSVICFANSQLLRQSCQLNFANRQKSTINVEQSSTYGFLIPNIDLKEVGAATSIGKRQYQEDRFCYKPFNDGSIFMGIFDGHGGSLAADFTVSKLPSVIENVIDDTTDLKESFEKAFVEVNTELMEYIRRGQESRRYSGTTATVCLITHNIHLHTASVGDTRAILCRNGKAVTLTTDHNPENEKERKRIEQEGGLIVSNSLGEPLVNGRLAMTRSIGDFDLKPYGVTSVPECSYTTIKPAQDSFLILITDGVSFSLPDQEVVDVVLSCSTTQEAANQVIDLAACYGSVDNASAVLLPLGSWGRFAPSGSYVPNRSLFAPRD